MGEQEQTTLAQQLEDALRGLQRALSEAGAAATTAHASLTQIAALEDRARDLDVRLGELEAAVTLARETLNIPIVSGQQASFPQLRAVPSWEKDEQAGDDQETPARHAEGAPVLRLEVEKKVGSLDLKQVDGAVNEIPVITDVALVDYDGRHATLKLWIAESEDAEEVSATLLKELRSRLGGESVADVHVMLEEDAA